MVNRIADYSVFSTFNLKSAYHQLKIISEKRIYTTFEANESLHEFKNIRTGVTKSVPKIQRKVEKVRSSRRS